MGDSITFKAPGLEELGRRMRALTNEVNVKMIRRAARDAAILVRDAAKARAPVETGAMRDSIQVRRDRRSSTAGIEVFSIGVFKIPGGKYANTRFNRAHRRVGASYQVDPPTYYFRFVELGTVKMQAKPFLGPSLKQNVSAAIEIMRGDLTADIVSAVAKQG